jgi:uncharacterized membrane protein
MNCKRISLILCLSSGIPTFEFSSWNHKRQHERNFDLNFCDLENKQVLIRGSCFEFIVLTDTKSSLFVLQLVVRRVNPRVINLIVGIARNHDYVLG